MVTAFAMDASAFLQTQTRIPDSRGSASYLTVKYGLRLMEKMKVILQAVPGTIEPTRRHKLIAEIGETSVDEVEEMVRDLEQLAPLYSQEPPYITSTQILCPPVLHCLKGCRYRIGNDKDTPMVLKWQREPTKAVLYNIDGKTVQLKVLILRCRSCESRYQYQTWSSAGHYHFYDQPREYVQVSRQVYVPRGFARYVSNSVIFDHSTYEGIAASFQNTYPGFDGFTEKIVSTLFLRYEVECDLTEKNQRAFAFRTGQGLFQYIDHIIPGIFATVYSHRCSPQCVLEGCGTLYTSDGLWRIGFRHCKAAVTNTVNSIPLIRFPNVCTSACKGRSEYCSEHSWMEASDPKPVANSNETKLLFPGAKTLIDATAEDINVILSGELQQDAEVFDCNEFNPDKQCIKNKGNTPMNTVTDATIGAGVSTREDKKTFAWVYIAADSHVLDSRIQLRPASVNTAESLGQVFLFLIGWLYQVVQKLSKEQWSKIVLAYDNMCQLNRLKASRLPLPLPAPYDTMWSEITKVVDGLHIRNHRDPRCKVKYHPDLYYAAHPEMKDRKSRNTMSAEQTFAWLANFRKQINAMPKHRQIFFIHRLVVHRNEYLSNCIVAGKAPTGGTARTFLQKGNRA